MFGPKISEYKLLNIPKYQEIGHNKYENISFNVLDKFIFTVVLICFEFVIHNFLIILLVKSIKFVNSLINILNNNL